MFCPRCSQEQVSDAVRYCARCGLALDGVKAVLATGGLPEAARAGDHTADRPHRKRDRTVGAFLMFLLALVAAAITVDMPASHSARIILLAIAWLVLTVALNAGPLARYMLGRSQADEAERGGGRGAELPSRTPPPALSSAPPLGVPASAVAARGAETAEVVRGPSVTEHTTELLRGE